MPEHRLKVCERSSRRQKCIFSSGDFDSAQSPCYIYYYYRCLNLSKAHSIPPPVISTPLNHRCYIYCYSRCLSLSKAQYINPYPYNFLIIKVNRLLCYPSKPVSFSCSNPEPAFLDKKLHLLCQILRNRPIAQAIFFGCG